MSTHDSRNTAFSRLWLPTLIAVAGVVACVSPSQVPPTEVALLDADQDGVLDPYEALDGLLSIERELGRPISVQDLRDRARDEWAEGMQEFDEFLKAFDFDGDGVVTVKELEEHAAEGDEEMLFSAQMSDSDGDGAISAEEMLYGGGEEAFFLSADEIAAELDLLFGELPLDQDGAIDLASLPEEFPLSELDFDGDRRLEWDEAYVALIADNSSAFFQVEGSVASMNGVITASTPAAVLRLLFEHPEVDTIEMQIVPGSIDDHANLRAAHYVRDHGLATTLGANARIASGGTDFFLAGRTRTVAEGAEIGVHSWSGGPGEIGQELSRDAPQHQLYLDYYQAMGIPTDFYWFTLESAPADRIHIMTEEEITRYRFRTSAAP